jgi:hypothetical protein
MASELRILATLLTLLAVSGCGGAPPMGPPGLLLTYATRPLTTNFHRTPVVSVASGDDPAPSRNCANGTWGGSLLPWGVCDFLFGPGNVFQLEYYVRVVWGDNSIGGLAEAAGFDEVYYADITTLSIYTYVKMERVTVYGHRAGTPPVPETKP